jgi:hypothetical protein
MNPEKVDLLAGLVAFGYSNESGVSRDALIAWDRI